MKKAVFVFLVLVLCVCGVYYFTSDSEEVSAVKVRDLKVDGKKASFGTQIERTEKFINDFNQRISFKDFVTSSTPASVLDALKPFPALVVLGLSTSSSQELLNLAQAGQLAFGGNDWRNYVENTQKDMPSFPFHKVNVNESCVKLLPLKDIPSSFVKIKLVTPDEIAGAVPGKDYFVSMEFMLIGDAATIKIAQYGVLHDSKFKLLSVNMQKHVAGDEAMGYEDPSSSPRM